MIIFSRNRFKFNLTKKIFFLDYCEFNKLAKNAYKAQQNNHMEVCGLICINRSLKLKIFFIKNRSVKPYQYCIYDRDINLFQKKIDSSYKILGEFHSHPVGLAYPSESDLETPFYNNIAFIYNVCDKDLKMWYRYKLNGRVVVITIPFLIKNKINLDRWYGWYEDEDGEEDEGYGVTEDGKVG